MYCESKAFCANGTTLFAGFNEMIEVAEAKHITIGRYVHVSVNWIPEDAGQENILHAIQDCIPMRFIIQLPLDRGAYQYERRMVDGQVELLPGKEAILSFSFPAYDGAIDPADDGPEVEVINRELDIRVVDILTAFFSIPEVQEECSCERLQFSNKEFKRPAGGGFTEVVTLEPGLDPAKQGKDSIGE